MKLFEFTALIEYGVVVAAENEKDARAAIETWENAWHDTGDFLGVVAVALANIRSIDPECDLDDVAHEIVQGGKK